MRRLLAILAMTPLVVMGGMAAGLAILGICQWHSTEFPTWQANAGSQGYEAIGELLLVAVIAIEGVIAYFALRNDERGARASANDAIFKLYEMYMTVDYHEKVRTVARYSLWKARNDPTYRKQLIVRLSGQKTDDEFMKALDKKRNGRPESAEDHELLVFHSEYHRVLDILGFFTTLSLLQANADAKVLRICNFFYDSWRFSLRRIVTDLETAVASQPAQHPRAYLGWNRLSNFKTALDALDRKFRFKPIDINSADDFRNLD
jgi:hypothetical protein